MVSPPAKRLRIVQVASGAREDCYLIRGVVRHSVPASHPPEHPIPQHRLHGLPQVFSHAEPLAGATML
jgi:hypothetical protein